MKLNFAYIGHIDIERDAAIQLNYACTQHGRCEIKINQCIRANEYILSRGITLFFKHVIV